MSETRTYIKIWLCAALIVNLVAFSALQIDADKIIKCNRTYNLVYPVANCQGFVVPFLAFASCKITLLSLSFTVWLPFSAK